MGWNVSIPCDLVRVTLYRSVLIFKNIFIILQMIHTLSIFLLFTGSGKCHLCISGAVGIDRNGLQVSTFLEMSLVWGVIPIRNVVLNSLVMIHVSVYRAFSFIVILTNNLLVYLMESKPIKLFTVKFIQNRIQVRPL
jgi:hypothetical protein